MTTPEPTQTRTQGFATLLETLRRRKLLAMLPFLFVLATAASLAFFLPSIWRAQSVIMVGRQTIPESFVKPSVAGDLEGRLLTLSQEIMERERLLEVIDRYGLYPKLRGKLTPDELVDKMRKDIRIEFYDEKTRRTRDKEGRSFVFLVGYTAPNPAVAADVTNTLASLYVQANARLRERQAASTSDFLQAQLAEVRKKLSEQEAKIAAYKEQHMGELPEQKETNLRTVDRLQQQLMAANENHRRAVERRQMMTQTLAEIDMSSGGTVAGVPAVMNAPDKPSANQARLTLLRMELAQLQTKFSDKYPDVIYTKEQIRTLEAEVAAEATHKASAQTASASPRMDAEPKAEPKKGFRTIPQSGYVQSLMGQLDQANLDAKAGAEQIADLQRQIAAYQRRVEHTPRREHELSLITRDYESTQTMFRTLLAKREEAGIAADLEQTQKGEHFRILEPAMLPDKPLGPNRMRLLMIGLALAVGAAGAAVVLAENVDTSFRRVDELRARLTVPILSAIPRITTEADRLRGLRRRRAAVAAFGLGLLTIIGASYAVAHNNQELVGLLTSDSTSAPKR